MKKNKHTAAVVLFSSLLTAACGGGGSGSDGAPPATNVPVAEESCLLGDLPVNGRSLVDRADDVAGAQLHWIYAIPADSADRELDINGQIQTEMQVAQRWLGDQVGRCMRMDTFQGGLDVTFMQFSRTNDEMRADPEFVDQTVALELEARGLDDPEKVYVVYYGGSTDTGSCGGAAAIGGPAMQFLATQSSIGIGQPSCPFFRYVDTSTSRFRGSWSGVAVHEVFHSLGMVPFCAPDHDDPNPLHLSTVSSDLMAFDSTGFNVFTLDEARTQYYGHNNQGCPDLQDSAVWADADALADPLPGRTVYSTPESIPCADEPTTQSVSGRTGVNARFVNMTESPLFFYLLDESGIRQTPDLVAPFTQFFRGAAEEEVFVATNADSGECVGVYRMVPGVNRVLITE